MSETNSTYWLERLLHDSAKVYNFAEGQLSKLRKEYQKAVRDIEKELLSASKVEKVARLEQVKKKLLAHIDRLFEYEEALTKETLFEIYEEGFYRSVFNVQQALGYGAEVVFLAPTAAEVAIGIAWSGKNYSERIWQHHDVLAKKVEQTLTKGTILGQSNAQMAKQLAQEMDATFSNAARLVRTETNYIHNQATKAGYEKLGLEQYEFLATLDLRTSATCAALDGKKFNLEDAQVGVNYPPMHPNCRSTTIPVVEYDAEEVRLAKLNGDYYEVPATMTYEQWYESIVKEHGADKIAQMKKMVQNESKDRSLHAAFKKSIGVDAPQSFADFQQLKYNSSNEWAALKRQRATFDKINAKDYTDPYKKKMKNLYRYFSKEGFEFTDHSLNRVLGQKMGKDKRTFTKDELVSVLKKPANYVQENGRLIRFYDGIAIAQSPKTNEVITVVTKTKPSQEWRESK